MRTASWQLGFGVCGEVYRNHIITVSCLLVLCATQFTKLMDYGRRRSYKSETWVVTNLVVAKTYGSGGNPDRGGDGLGGVVPWHNCSTTQAVATLCQELPGAGLTINQYWPMMHEPQRWRKGVCK